MSVMHSITNVTGMMTVNIFYVAIGIQFMATRKTQTLQLFNIVKLYVKLKADLLNNSSHFVYKIHYNITCTYTCIIINASGYLLQVATDSFYHITLSTRRIDIFF